ncbi:MAG TPA: methyltransferase [Planctomycetota bacterium]|nr:methyltransferase [Planctomycetota bacterium]
MPRSALKLPEIDPTPLFEIFRGSYATELLAAAVAHFDIFSKLKSGPVSFDALRAQAGLAVRPAIVLFTALRAMGLISSNPRGELELTAMAREHLVTGGEFDVSGYVGLVADAPNVKEMTERLKTDKPANAKDEKGAAFIYRDGIESAMEKESSARHLTLALAGRARNCAPALAQRVPLSSARVLLDVGGGTGIYSIACLQKNPSLKAIVWDRPEVLKVASEMAAEYGVSARLECRSGDMFADPVPSGVDAVLLSNVLHDWDVPQCRELIAKCVAALPAGGRILIHDVFLNDALDGPLPIALYSAALFTLTEGRAYSAAEYRSWLVEAGLKPKEIVPTLVHCGVLEGVK